jgi:hypothetical protein
MATEDEEPFICDINIASQFEGCQVFAALCNVSKPGIREQLTIGQVQDFQFLSASATEKCFKTAISKCAKVRKIKFFQICQFSHSSHGRYCPHAHAV